MKESYSNYFFYNNECYVLTMENCCKYYFKYDNGILKPVDDTELLARLTKFYSKKIPFSANGYEAYFFAIMDNDSIHFKTIAAEKVKIIYKDLPENRRKYFLNALRTYQFNDLDTELNANAISQKLFRQFIGVCADCQDHYGFSDSNSSYSLLNEGMFGLLVQRKFPNDPILYDGELIYSKLVEQLIYLTSENIVFDAFYNGKGIEPVKKSLYTFCKDKEFIDELFLKMRGLYLHRSMTTPQNSLSKIQVYLLELAYYKAKTLPKEEQRNFLVNFKKFMVTKNDVKKSVIAPRYIDLEATEDIYKMYSLLLKPQK